VLFSIGLSINVWELNKIVAIPIIAISGSAALFYIWSSIASYFIRFYPYTTWITNILVRILSNIIALLVSGMITLISITISPLLSYIISPLTSKVLVPLTSHLLRSSFLKICAQVLVTWLWPLGALAGALFGILYIIFGPLWKLSKVIYSGILKASQDDRDKVQKIEFDDETGSRIQVTVPGSERQGEITSLALQWLIENCENPDSVSIALQAIAGASSKHPLEPLTQCNAALKILQKMVSSYSEDRLETQRYTRALKFLAHGDSSNQAGYDNNNAGELEVTIWELRSLNET
jgi:hypothetical protein